MGIETLILSALFVASAAVAISGYQKAKKAARAAAEGAAGVLYQTRVTAAPRRLVYGTARVGGLEAYFTTSGTDNDFLHFILMWCEGPCESVEVILFDGVEVPLNGSGDCVSGDYDGLVHVESKTGEPGQSAITQAVTEMAEWTTNDKLLGICYSWVRLKYDRDAFPNGAPSISARVAGSNDVVDVSDDSSDHSENVALCMAHYMTRNNILGMGLDLSDDFNDAALLAARNTCAEAVAVSTGGTQSRYTYNGVIHLDADPEDILDLFITAMAGNRAYIQGEWHINAGEYFTPTFTIDEDMLVDEVEMVTRPSKRDRVNEIRGIYVSEGNNYFPTDFPAYSEAQYIADDGETNSEDVELIGTATVMMARRIAKIFLLRSRYARQVTVKCNIEAFELVPGKTCLFTFPKLGFQDTPMDVNFLGTAITEDQGVTITLDLKETNSAIYAWDDADDEAGSEATTALGDVPSAPTNNAGASAVSIAGGLAYTLI